MLTKLNLDIHSDSEMSQRIRRELRRLRWLMLCAAMVLLVLFVVIASGCTPQKRVPVNSIPASSPDTLLMEIPDLNHPWGVSVWLRSMADKEEIHAEGKMLVLFYYEGAKNPLGVEHDGVASLGLKNAGVGVSAVLKDGEKVLHEGTFLKVKVYPSDGVESIELGGHVYQGRFDINVVKGQGLRIINTVSLEKYTKGSVGWEAIPSWPIEALKAQAVAIRTYTLFTLYHNKARGIERDWDVDDTTRYLKYGGLGRAGAKQMHANANVQRAVKETDGEIMLHKGKIFKAFFASNSGGRSASVATSFGLKSIPPLAGVDLGDYGEGSSLYRWSRDHDLAHIESALAKVGKAVGAISKIRVETNDPSGFAQRVVVVGKDAAKTLDAAEFRRALGTGRKGLPSTNFTVQIDGDKATFTGKGWGHGVGMDQWAAHGMAKAGMGYRQILRRHYPEINVTRPWLKSD